ncbi:hypothetical protein BABINDRAFT_145034 [Babjeviella inositovora NRRL Y-12698]|uniref:Uncharacterized protein n=1 Tax=Babjeviella inositovora NRRL Y-12698 TaxID=984486 RepID=A0A1E3QPE6_9ASCO|nr:uncharacterized protein BABINDRAFT_145034 [Babjeviella inositovora NRRL Y-12698]ODQ79573.1 hypothetical protein BABINDRAFT_145034 [Babjeviella inositovora NRRL Y-12698]
MHTHAYAQSPDNASRPKLEAFRRNAYPSKLGKLCQGTFIDASLDLSVSMFSSILRIELGPPNGSLLAQIQFKVTQFPHSKET